MPTIDFNCTNCGQKLSADKSLSESITLCPSCEQAIRVPKFNAFEGMVLGDFVLKSKIGTGGMGDVWLAEQKSMQREVALKILSPTLAEDEDFCTRFQQEAKNSGKMMHPNIVTAFSAGVEENLHYLAMSYVNGSPLDEILLAAGKTTPLTNTQILGIILDIAKALKYGWDNFKLVHRDIKPSNIMLSKDGSAKLLDLGISKSIIEGDSALTRTGLFVGTPYYISPEQAKNTSDLDCRADIYSLGAVLYHMLTGNVPYNATTPMGVVAMHLAEPLPDIKKCNPHASWGIIELVGKMMEKDRTHRIKTWDEVIQETEKLLNGKEPSRRLKLRLKNKTKILSFIIIIVITLIIASIAAKTFLTSTPPQNDPEEEQLIEDTTPSSTLPSTATPKKIQQVATSSIPVIKQPVASSKNTVQQPKIVKPEKPHLSGPEETFMGFFAGRAHLSAREQQEVRSILAETRKKMRANTLLFKQGDLTRTELRNRNFSIKQEERRSLRAVLSEEQMKIYREWDTDRWRRDNRRD